ncbi:MAG: glycosyltransferase [Candidatus Stahlbacteria bacterium]|nr:glycosyltransferase [Candidatus Stahlbacteria bacterium]
MKILHINWSGRLGGAERFVCSLALYQKAEDRRQKTEGRRQRTVNRITIAYMSDKSVLGVETESKDIKVVEFKMRSGFDILNFIRYVFFILREQFDVIHDHNGPPLVRLSKLFSRRSIFIQHIHGTKFGNQKWERSYVILWNRLTCGLVDHYIANSSHTKKIVSAKENIPLSRISVVYNGIDLAEFTGIGDDKRISIRKELGLAENEWVVGIVGRLTLQKGIDKFIQVAESFFFNKNMRFVIVGEGEIREELERLVKSKGLTGRVIFTGGRKDISAVLKIFDIFLLTSNWEPFGIVLVEAMASGIPVVAFNVDGVSEVVDEGCGMLIPPDIDEAVKSILFLKENPSVARQMAINGLKLANQKFDIQRKVKEIEDIYLSLYKSSRV